MSKAPTTILTEPRSVRSIDTERIVGGGDETTGTWFCVGQNAIGGITPYEETGPHSMLTWFLVVDKEGETVARIPAYKCDITYDREWKEEKECTYENSALSS